MEDAIVQLKTTKNMLVLIEWKKMIVSWALKDVKISWEKKPHLSFKDWSFPMFSCVLIMSSLDFPFQSTSILLLSNKHVNTSMAAYIINIPRKRVRLLWKTFNSLVDFCRVNEDQVFAFDSFELLLQKWQRGGWLSDPLWTNQKWHCSSYSKKDFNRRRQRHAEYFEL